MPIDEEHSMDGTTYKQWWPLHLRQVTGETLTPEEQAFYQTGLEQLHKEEILHQGVEGLRQMREEIEQLKAENRRLQVLREQLEAKAAALEAALSERTRQLIGVGD